MRAIIFWEKVMRSIFMVRTVIKAIAMIPNQRQFWGGVDGSIGVIREGGALLPPP